jgi:hypothetical protein
MGGLDLLLPMICDRRTKPVLGKLQGSLLSMTTHLQLAMCVAEYKAMVQNNSKL